MQIKGRKKSTNVTDERGKKARPKGPAKRRTNKVTMDDLIDQAVSNDFSAIRKGTTKGNRKKNTGRRTGGGF